VRAYGRSGRRELLEMLTENAGSFPTTVLSITAAALEYAVRVDYHDGSGETLRCGRGPGQDVVIALVETHRAAAGGSEAAAEAAEGQPSGVEILWWAVRFLHADIARDYAAQRRYLAADAAAFGAVGREACAPCNAPMLP
jgi:hypothetical protein